MAYAHTSCRIQQCKIKATMLRVTALAAHARAVRPWRPTRRGTAARGSMHSFWASAPLEQASGLQD
jgi:hypothetical protein